MSLTVRAVEPSDVAALAGLLEEMECFYGATEFPPTEERIRGISDTLFSDPPSASALLAWDDSDLIGLACYSFLWPAVGVTRSLYLKELYVAKSHQRQGVGKRLIYEIFDVGLKNQCSRVEWTTDTDNPQATEFYKSLGVAVNREKLFYRVEGIGLTAAVAELQET